MRKIIPNRKVSPDNVLITQNLKVLLYYDEPYLYYGQTKKGTLVIGAAVDEDEEQGINRYTHIKVSRPELVWFLEGSVTLYSLFRDYNKKIYVVDMKNDKTNIVYECDFNGIPDNYIPSVDSYCPEDTAQNSEEVTFVDISKTVEFSELLDLAAMTSYREINKLPQEKKKIAQSQLKIGRKLEYESAVYCAKHNLKSER